MQWDGFSEITPEDLAQLSAGKPAQPELPYEDDPVRKLISHLLTKRQGGGFWSYEEMKETGTALLGFAPFADAHDLKAKLFRIAGKLREREGIVVRGGQKKKGARGIYIEEIIGEDS